MQVKRIRDLIKEDRIQVIDAAKGFTVRDLTAGYLADSDDGYTTDSVFGFDGRLNIRPSYQRNSVYSQDKRDAVMMTVLEECPLNTIYFVDKEDGTYEVLDGQQRILSICKYISGEFAVASDVFPTDLPQDFQNLVFNMHDIADKIMDYELEVYVCKGTPSEKLKWFHRINTCGEPLNEQELRNSSYTGKWLSDAKARFSSKNGRGVILADTNPNNGASEPLLAGSWNRQEYLETALLWAARHEGFTGKNAIEEYMLKHCKDNDASALWQYFSCVLEWVRGKFTTYNKAMKGLDWGAVYEDYTKGVLNNNIIHKNADDVNKDIVNLMNDDEITAKMKGIIMYIIYGDERYLQFRQFEEKTARIVYEKQGHKCPFCVKNGNNKEYTFKEMQADHVKPWSKGGKTIEENCQMLCSFHNNQKGNIW